MKEKIWDLLWTMGNAHWRPGNFSILPPQERQPEDRAKAKEATDQEKAEKQSAPRSNHAQFHYGIKKPDLFDEF